MTLVDWPTATGIGHRAVAPGPRIPPEQAAAAVAQLHTSAARAVALVADATGLRADPVAHATVVVDRTAWITANIESMAAIVAPLERRLAPANRIGARVTAAEVGLALAWLATKVLGQYEVIRPAGQRGRLLLVAQNIVHVEQQLQVPAADFRMWVCLHEETHRVQFGAVPWLADHFRGELDTFLAEVDVSGGEALRRAAGIVTALVRVLRGEPGASLLDAAQGPGQRAVFERLTALMTLLEGHADYVMDIAGPDAIPALAVIRSRFDARRANPGAADGLVRRLIGMDAKLAQYTEGRRFVAEVTRLAGRDGFNQVWTAPAALPTRAEIAAPRTWVERVLR